ncbi:hypothetical protein [Peribacillus butanolivorans]|nr:hypothetical protein [Peribacillus butanolivorans]
MDVTILDKHGTWISGTGYYQDLIGKPIPEGSFLKMILKTSKPSIQG